MSVALLAACGRTGDLEFDVATSTGGAEGSGGAGGVAGNGGAGGVAGDGGVDAIGDDMCVVTCCDGSLVTGTLADVVECRASYGMACAPMGGPKAVSFEGSAVWTADVPCPTMRPCRLNCCNGEKVTLAEQFDRQMCVEAGHVDGQCTDKGGAAKVLFGDKAVAYGATCEGNCQATCCDGTVGLSTLPSPPKCERWAGEVCEEEEGGPSVVAFDHTMVWNAGGVCPSLRECELQCQDGAEQVTQEYQESVCVGVSLSEGFCAEHGGAASVRFDGQTAWKAP